MRQRLIQFGAVLALLVCLCGQVSEIFDHWDNTLRTGTDIDYSTVIVGLIAGAVLVLARATKIRQTCSVRHSPSLSVDAARNTPTLQPFIGHSPPAILRI